MQEVWVLSEFAGLDIRQNFCIPQVVNSARSFARFEDARDALLQKLKEFSKEQTEYFDKNGRIPAFDTRISEWGDSDTDDSEEWDYDEQAIDFWEQALESLRELFCGEKIRKDYKIEVPEFDGEDACYDDLMACWVSNGELCIRGVDEGPDEGINPYIHTNMLDLTDPDKNYYLIFQLGFEEIYYQRTWSFSLRKTSIE